MAKQWDREINAYFTWLAPIFVDKSNLFYSKVFFGLFDKILVATTTKCETLESYTTHQINAQFYQDQLNNGKSSLVDRSSLMISVKWNSLAKILKIWNPILDDMLHLAECNK